MKRWIGVLLACLVCFGGGVGCKALSDTLNAGENERASNEANRKRFHQQRLEARQRKMEPVLRKAKKPPKETPVALDPESPEGMLLAELKARMDCRDDRCRSEALQRIRRHSAVLLPALPKLLHGQDDKVTIEALRLAGLFKVTKALEAVSRSLLLGDKAIQEEAVWSLGAIGHHKGVEALRRFSNLENPPRIMAAICRSLGQIGARSAVAPIEAVFMQGTAETRVECLNAAARIQGGKGRAVLERGIEDPRPVVSDVAAELLKGITSVNPETTKPAVPPED